MTNEAFTVLVGMIVGLCLIGSLGVALLLRLLDLD